MGLQKTSYNKSYKNIFKPIYSILLHIFFSTLYKNTIYLYISKVVNLILFIDI